MSYTPCSVQINPHRILILWMSKQGSERSPKMPMVTQQIHDRARIRTQTRLLQILCLSTVLANLSFKGPTVPPSLWLSPALGRTYLYVLVNEVMGMKTATGCYVLICCIDGRAPSQGGHAGHSLSFSLLTPNGLCVLLLPRSLRVWGSEAMGRSHCPSRGWEPRSYLPRSRMWWITH